MLNRCCCGCSLADGTRAIGVYNLVRVLLAFIPYGVIVIRKTDLSSHEVFEYTFVQKLNIYSLGVLVVISVLMLIFSCLLIIGVRKRKSSYLLPFLILDSLFICGWIVGIISDFAYSPPFMFDSFPVVEDPGLEIAGLIFHAFFTALEIYFFLVILACHKQFQIEENEMNLTTSTEMKPPPMYGYGPLMEDPNSPEVPPTVPRPPPYSEV